MSTAEQQRKYSLAYYYRNQKKCSARALAWYYKNRRKVLKKKTAEFRIAYKTEPDFNATERERAKLRHRKRVIEVKDLLGGKCVRCNFSDYRALQLDHIDGTGYLDKLNKVPKNPAFKIKEIKENPQKYQLLCANCNWIKRAENGEVRTYGKIYSLL